MVFTASSLVKINRKYWITHRIRNLNDLTLKYSTFVLTIRHVLICSWCLFKGGYFWGFRWAALFSFWNSKNWRSGTHFLWFLKVWLLRSNFSIVLHVMNGCVYFPSERRCYCIYLAYWWLVELKYFALGNCMKVDFEYRLSFWLSFLVFSLLGFLFHALVLHAEQCPEKSLARPYYLSYLLYYM